MKTHTREPVPYALYDSQNPQESGRVYTEDEAAKAAGAAVPGPGLLERLLAP